MPIYLIEKCRGFKRRSRINAKVRDIPAEFILESIHDRAKNWNRFEKSYDGRDLDGRIIGKALNGGMH
ncbi:MAG: hypothetical protein ACLU4J_03250 [Butyricimonas paravirosa]